ncbi:MAG TPA: glycosyltransferase, partial [Rhodospirillales bacterium]|nr:glycosyltransferase [Rhodospirillales bacterium]
GHGAAPDDPRFAAVREVDYVSAATVLLRTADFLRAGGFDPAWDPAYYEDSDLCLKLSVLGLNTCYCPESSVIHHESVTTSDPRTALKIETLKAINRGIFVERWGGWLAARADQPQAIAGVASIDPPVLLPAPAQPQRPAGRLLLVTDAPLLPGGSVRHLLAFAEALRESHAAWIATPERSSRLRVHAIAAALGLELGAVETLAADETGLLPPFDLAVVASPQAWPGRPAPASRSLLLCHGDKMPPAADLAQCCRWWPGYARLLVGSAAMRQRLLAQLARLDLPAPPVEVLPCPIGPVVPRETAAPGAVTVILNVGRFGGPAAGRQQRLIEAFRLLAVNREMHFELHLAGAISADAADRDAVIRCRQTAGNLPVFFHVNATRRRLQQLYRRADAYWHDVAAAADSIPASPRVSIALLEAMAAGLLCFAPASSAVPIGDGITGCIVDGASDLAGKTRQRLARGSTDAGSIPGRAAAAAAAYAPTALQPRYRRIAAASEESAAEGGGGSRPPT